MNKNFKNTLFWLLGVVLCAFYFFAGTHYLFNDKPGISFIMLAIALLTVFLLSAWHDDGMGGCGQGQC